jgi:hypothetical protein
VDEFHIANQRRLAAVLRSVLHDPIVFPGRRYDLLPLIDAVGHRLLDIHVLSGLARPNGRQRVPMVRCRDSDCIDVFILQRLSNIFVCFWRFTLFVGHELCAILQYGRIDVAQCHILRLIRMATENVPDMAAPLAVKADRADTDPTVCAEDFAVRHRTGNNDRSGGLSQELTAGELSRGRISIYRCGFHQVWSNYYWLDGRDACFIQAKT